MSLRPRTLAALIALAAASGSFTGGIVASMQCAGGVDFSRAAAVARPHGGEHRPHAPADDSQSKSPCPLGAPSHEGCAVVLLPTAEAAAEPAAPPARPVMSAIRSLSDQVLVSGFFHPPRP